jgi:hypothetical protein
MYNYKKRERRKYERYETKAKVYFRIIYEIETKIEFQIVTKKQEGESLSQKYSAISKNVSVEGLCFASEKQLKKGDMLYLEVYLPRRKNPIHMQGQVRWSQVTSPQQQKEGKYDTGVKLISVEGKSVMASIHYDEANHLIWSVVLESIFGSFRRLIQNKPS